MHLSFCSFVAPLGSYRLAPKTYLYKYLENGKELHVLYMHVDNVTKGFSSYHHTMNDAALNSLTPQIVRLSCI